MKNDESMMDKNAQQTRNRINRASEFMKDK